MKPVKIALILALGLSQSGCIALAVGTVAGVAIGVTAKGVGMTARGVGHVAGAIIPGGGDKKDDKAQPAQGQKAKR